MFDFISKSEVQPLMIIVIGILFILAVSLWYRRDFYCTRRQGRLDRFSKKLKNVLYQGWRLLSGVAVTAGLFGLYTIFTGSIIPSQVLAEVMPAHSPALSPHTHTSVKSVPKITKTIIDTNKPWIYDFSKLPDGPIDTRVFTIDNGPKTANYNNELQTYTNSTQNVRVQDGALILEAKPESKDGKAYTSGRINTAGTFNFNYGKLEVTAKLPHGVGTWPAAWLMPAQPRYQASDYPYATDQTRLYTLNGELDFLESVGYIPGQNIPAAHSYNSLAQAPQYTPAFTADPYDEYHTYGIIKTPNLIEFTIDDTVYAKRTKVSDSPLSWPFNQPYYLILNLSVGGTWAGKEGVDNSSAPWEYMIKSITYTPTP